MIFNIFIKMNRKTESKRSLPIGWSLLFLLKTLKILLGFWFDLSLPSRFFPTTVLLPENTCFTISDLIVQSIKCGSGIFRDKEPKIKLASNVYLKPFKGLNMCVYEQLWERGWEPTTEIQSLNLRKLKTRDLNHFCSVWAPQSQEGGEEKCWTGLM